MKQTGRRSGKSDRTELGDRIVDIIPGRTFRGEAQAGDPGEGFAGFCRVTGGDGFPPDDYVVALPGEIPIGFNGRGHRKSHDGLL